jgi:F-type H+-transporting ATPase subunit a
MKRLVAALFALIVAVALPASAFAAEGEDGEFAPEHEFELHSWLDIKIGGLDLSVNKAVAYLWLGALCTMALGIVLMRFRLKQKPGNRQTLGEIVYEMAQKNIAEDGLPAKAVARWFPFVATLMLFIWVVNLLGFIPLPLSDEKFTIAGTELPTFGIYAATASISVTITLALMTFVFTHVEGIRWNGPVKYFKSWIPDAPPAALVLIVPIEILSQFMRLISLSVRLFANMLAGPMLILVMIGLIFVLEKSFLAIVSVPVATAFYLFEVVIVISIQAFIFASLSAIYIGSAIEPEH